MTDTAMNFPFRISITGRPAAVTADDLLNDIKRGRDEVASSPPPPDITSVQISPKS